MGNKKRERDAFTVYKNTCTGDELVVPKGTKVIRDVKEPNGYTIEDEAHEYWVVECKCGTEGTVADVLLESGSVTGCSRCMRLPEKEIVWLNPHLHEN